MSLNKVIKTALLVTALVSGLSASAEDNIPDPFAQMKANADASNPTAVPANGVAPAPIVIPEPPVFDAQSWVLMDYSSGRIICEHNAH